MGGPKLPTPEEAAWQLEHPHDDLRAAIIALSAVNGSLATLFVGLRVWSRRLLHGRYHFEANDLLCITAWVFYVGFLIATDMATRYGYGRHIVFTNNPRLAQTWSIVSENLYAAVLALLKLSILSLYRQIFGSTVWFYRATWVLTFIVTSLGLWVILASDFQCVPIAASWDLSIKGTCINYGLSGLLAYIVNILTDLTILSLPIPLVLKLNVSKPKRRMLLITFAAGGSACIVSIVQLRYVPKLGSTADATWDNAPIGIISFFECMTGFLASSIATYRPLYRYLILKQSPITDDARKFHGASDSSYSARIMSNKKLHTETSITELSRGIHMTEEVELVSHVRSADDWPGQLHTQHGVNSANPHAGWHAT
ncbi:hypothetical protein F4825DRAFT_442572 [Nemania diffusa]|nr:hypothetical protein F4825DRAFT_442572 [Nemania diffusa]